MWTLAGAWTKLTLMTATTLLVGCVNVQTAAICDGTIASRDMLNQALLDDAGPRSQVAGAILIQQLDQGCYDA
jgi:hypothetical protein